jgi:hypothetical protein
MQQFNSKQCLFSAFLEKYALTFFFKFYFGIFNLNTIYFDLKLYFINI